MSFLRKTNILFGLSCVLFRFISQINLKQDTFRLKYTTSEWEKWCYFAENKDSDVWKEQ